MCGIAGVWDPAGATPADGLRSIAEAMTDALAHRGPDDHGVWLDARPGIALGHRRLSIVDLSAAGHQPMASSCGRYVVTYNGELYNTAALRDELTAAGRHFRGTSDTEVLLEGFSEWGIRPTVERAAGMFALAVWDRTERTLTLGRDRVGKKPLYHGWAGGSLVFGSELKALRAHPGFRGEIDRDALTLLLRHKYIPAPWTVYRGIRKLMPATLLTIGPGPADERAATYWSATEAASRGATAPLEGSVDDTVEILDRSLREAVSGRMIADVPLGAFLSGGIDSATIVALMQAQSMDKVRTFTIGVRDEGYDEAERAGAIAAHLGTDHTELYVTSQDVLDAIPRIPVAYDEPFADSSQIPTMLLAALAREHVTVALTGDGGDEVFGGYNRHTWAPSVERRLRRIPAPVRARAGRALTRVDVQTWRRVFERAGKVTPARLRLHAAGEKVHKLADALLADGPEALYLRLTSHWKDPGAVVLGAREPRTPISDPGSWPALPTFAEQMMALDLTTYLPDDILTKVDRATMAVALEARNPYLDHRVIELAWRLPIDLKVRDGTGKWILRRVLDRYVPRVLVDGPKSGFGIPIGGWLRDRLRPWAEDLLSEERLRRDGLFDVAAVRGAWQAHLDGHDRRYLLWDVLMVQAWLDEHHRARAGVSR